MDEMERHYWAALLDAMRQVELERAQSAPNQHEKPVLPLRKRISDWFCAMKWDTGRCYGYTMRELSERFDTPPNVLGPVLTEMGWVRKRDWSGGRAQRFWAAEADCLSEGRVPCKPCHSATAKPQDDE